MLVNLLLKLRFNLVANMNCSSFISWDVDCEEIYDDEGDVIDEIEYALIHKIFVVKEERRQGKARKMLLDAIAEIKEEGHSEVRIAAYPFDDEECDIECLVEFYESVGFEVIPSECHAVIMSMSL